MKKIAKLSQAALMAVMGYEIGNAQEKEIQVQLKEEK